MLKIIRQAPLCFLSKPSSKKGVKKTQEKHLQQFYLKTLITIINIKNYYLTIRVYYLIILNRQFCINPRIFSSRNFGVCLVLNLPICYLMFSLFFRIIVL